MPENDDIPILTDAIDRAQSAATRLSGDDIEELQRRLCASSLKLAEDALREASREAERALQERVMATLRAELPVLVRGVLNERLKDRS